MISRSRLLVCALFTLFLTGCPGKGQVIPLDIDSLSANGPKPQTGQSFRVAILPFEDHRAEKDHIGMRRHFWGGKTFFDLTDGTPGEAVAQMLAAYLEQHGWEAQVVASERSKDLEEFQYVLSGEIVEFSALAWSKFGYTDLTATFRSLVEARHPTDKRQAMLTMGGSVSTSEFWFEPEDLRELVKDVLRASAEGFMVELQTWDRRLDES